KIAGSSLHRTVYGLTHGFVLESRVWGKDVRQSPEPAQRRSDIAVPTHKVFYPSVPRSESSVEKEELGTDVFSFLQGKFETVVIDSVFHKIASAHAVQKSKVDSFGLLAVLFRHIFYPFPHHSSCCEGVNVLALLVRLDHSWLHRQGRSHPQLNL